MKSQTKIFIYTTLDMWGSKKDSKYVKINSVNPLYLIINKANAYFEEIDKNKCLMLVPTKI